MGQNYVYNTLFPQWFGVTNSLETVSKEVFTDMFVLTPFLCFPVMYLISAAVKAEAADGESFMDAGLRKYMNHIKNENLLLKNWLLWIPVQTISFAMLPPELRIPFNSAVSFVWMMILSAMSTQQGHPQQGKPQPTTV